MFHAFLMVAAVAGASAHWQVGPGHAPGWCLEAVTEVTTYCPQNTEGSLPLKTTYFVCASDGAAAVKCKAPVPPYSKAVAVTLDKAHTSCTEDKTYGVTSDGAWVSSGCTATFAAQVDVDKERCERVRNVAQSPPCAMVARDWAVCLPDIRDLCGPTAAPPSAPMNEWQMGRVSDTPASVDDAGRSPGDTQQTRESRQTRRRPHPHHRPHDAHHLFQGYLSRQYGECLAEHAAAFGPECRNTKLFQMVAEDVWHGPAESVHFVVMHISCALTFGMGLLYFLWKRRQWSARRAPTTAVKSGGWSTGLFTCDWASCLPSFLCPGFQSALVQAEIHNRDSSVADVVMNLPPQSVLVNTYRSRQALREKYDMPDEPVKDFLVSAFCLPCVIAQHTREVEGRFEDVPVPEPTFYVEPVTKKLASDSMMI